MINCDKLSPLLDKKYSKKIYLNYALIYTALFAVLAFCTFIWFTIDSKVTIFDSDGYVQHYSSLRYFGVYCRRILKNLLTTGTLVIPRYDFSLGYGLDVLTTLNYYAIGDPLNILSMFVPVNYTIYLYVGLIFFRYWLAGLSFSLFCKKVFNTEKYATLIASFIYIFSLYGLHAGVKHPYFLNPLIYFPLILLGVEYIFAGKRPYLFVITLFVCAISNFYFFYMIVIFMIIYSAFRFFEIYKEHRIKAFFECVLKFGIYSFIAIGLAGFIFIPVITAMLGTNRSESHGYFQILYDFSYYKDIITAYIAPVGIGNWTLLGFSPLALISVVVLHFRAKEQKWLLIGFWLTTIMFLIPFCGFFLNGFSYVANRWGWAYALLVSVISAINIPYIFRLNNKQTKILITFCEVYCAISIITQYKSLKTLSLCCVLFFVICVLALIKKKESFSNNSYNSFKKTASLLLCVGIILTSSLYYNPNTSNYLNYYYSKDRFSNAVNSSLASVATKINDDSYYRYELYNSGAIDQNINGSMLYGTHSNGGYFSINSSSFGDLYNSICEEQITEQYATGFNSRSMMLALSSNKYYVTKEGEKAYLPYGYNKKVKNVKLTSVKGKDETETTYKIYKNTNYLPLGYTFDSCISRSNYDKLTPSQKQQAMIQSVVIEDEDKGIVNLKSNNSLHFTDKILDYSITQKSSLKTKDEIEEYEAKKDNSTSFSLQPVGQTKITNNSITTYKNDAKVTLAFDSVPNSETYVRLKNINFVQQNEEDAAKSQNVWNTIPNGKKLLTKVNDLSWSTASKSKVRFKSGKVERSFLLTNKYYQYNPERNDFDISIKYSTQGINYVTITFDEPGVYTFDSIDVVSVGMENYESDVAKLGENTLENIEYGNDEVSGTIDLEKSKLLCISLPYNEGWTAYVDSEKVDIVRANVAYMGIMVDAGHHDIKFTYETPYSHFGYGATALGVVGFVGAVVFCETNIRKKKREVKSV